MGGTNDEEQQRPSTSDEETLPLYEESQRLIVDNASELQLPEDTASPGEVRDFLVRILQARSIDLDLAQRIASRWTVGTGRELKSYTVGMYRDIFAEEGWVIYKDVKTMYYKKDKTDKNHRKTFGKSDPLADPIVFCRVSQRVVEFKPDFS